MMLTHVAAITSALLGVAAVVIVVLTWRRLLADTRIEVSQPFSRERLPPLHLYNLFEVGVVDLDGDDRLDLFTANHDFRQSYLLATAEGGYLDMTTRWELDQDQSFPGMEDQLTNYEPAAKHFSIYMSRRCLVLRDRGAAPVAIAGRIRINGRTAVRRARRAELRIKRPPSDHPGIGVSEIEFRIRRGGEVALFTPLLGTPIVFTLDAQIPLDRIHVGRGRRSPKHRNFTVRRRDRHGHAWADIDGTGSLDVYIGRGGFQGQIDAVRRAMTSGSLTIEDELLTFNGRQFIDRTAALGFAKKDCRTRGAAWVDFDKSGKLSLYVTCLTARNQLWVRQQDGRFGDVAANVGLDLKGCFGFVWVDLDRDGWIDLVIDEGECIAAYYNHQGCSFRRVPIVAKTPRFEVKLSVADFNRSGYPSIACASPAQLLLLVNEGGVLRPAESAAMGLPAGGLNAQWVDYDNDTNIELCVVPHGLYRQVAGGTFRRVDGLGFARPAQAVEALVQWFDSSNSGFRDVLIALRRPLPTKIRRLIDLWNHARGLWVGPDSRPDLTAPLNEGVGYEYYIPTISGRWTATLLKNCGNRNNWLEVVLDGAAGNRQAIGAVVTIEAATGRQLQGVGWAEGACYSQGHYRVYFGLGAASKIDRLEVRWPLGNTQELTNIPANQVLRIAAVD